LPPENFSRASVLVYHFVVDVIGFTSAGTQRDMFKGRAECKS